MAVYDGDGKQSGSTTRSVSYEVRRYNYHYRCAVCAHRWTRQGTSQRRMM